MPEKAHMSQIQTLAYLGCEGKFVTYDDIVKASLCKPKGKQPNIRPGWSGFMSVRHPATREAFKL